jgi:hypothetical protein
MLGPSGVVYSEMAGNARIDEKYYTPLFGSYEERCQ